MFSTLRDRELLIQGTLDATCRIEYSIELPAADWVTLSQITLTESPSSTTDTTPANAPQRFYRAIGLP